MRFLAVFVLFFCAQSIRADILQAEEDAKKFELSAALKAQAVAAEPLIQNPVSFSMDSAGRIWVGETYRQDNAVLDIRKNTNWAKEDLGFRNPRDRMSFLTNVFGSNSYQLTFTRERLNIIADENHDGIYETNHPTHAELNQPDSGLAGGVMAFNGKTYFACVPKLWIMDYTSPTNPIIRTPVFGFGVHIGVTGHDMHGFAVGMEGKLYFSMGDRGFTTRSSRGTISVPDTGAILRCNLDGTDLELFAVGLRNPQDLTFDALGNLWAVDSAVSTNDKSRLIHVVEGADYGWRYSYQFMEGNGPWVKEKLWQGKLDGTLPTCGEPAVNPMGLVYNPGTGLPKEYDGYFLVCDFPGGIESFTVEPKGASYVVKDRKPLLRNAWPTDVSFGTDGALYFSDWVKGYSLPYKGRIYRLTNPEITNEPKTKETARLLSGNFEKLETTNLLALLEYGDLRVRQQAHLELGHRKRESAAALREIAEDSAKPRTARLHAIWALRMQGAIEPAVVEKLLADKDPEIRAQSVGSAPAQQMLKLFKDENARVRFYAAAAYQSKILFDSNNSVAAEAILDLLEKNNDEDPYLTHVGSRLLGYSSPALQKAKRHTSYAVKRAALLAERSIGSPTIANYLKDPELEYEAARAINDQPIGAAFPQLAALLTNNCPTNVLSRSISINQRLGGTTPAKRLGEFATDEKAPVWARIDALDCLSKWEDPDELDRVIGLYRPIAGNVNTRPAALAVAALEPHWTNLLHDSNQEITLATLNCARELSAATVLPQVMGLFKASSATPAVRASALDTLRDLGDTNFQAALEIALGDPMLRLESLKYVDTNSSPAAVKQVIEFLSKADTAPLLQSSLAVVRRIQTSEAVEPLRALLQKLANKETPAEAGLDILETARLFASLKAEADAAAAKAYKNPLNEPLLLGGTASEGRKIFREKPEVSCVHCHMTEGIGGNIGPALDGLGSRQNRAYILESIRDPNKASAPGYDNITVHPKIGRTFTGPLVRETGATIELQTVEFGLIAFRRNDLARAFRSVSLMPEGLDQLLTPIELRDLVEYITSLK